MPKVPIPSVPIGGEKMNEAVTNSEGVTFLECEMAPGQLSPMHATPSIDFGVMITGEVVLILDSGEERTLR
jgi:quercetin dioxygenase-like cupin family protein